MAPAVSVRPSSSLSPWKTTLGLERKWLQLKHIYIEKSQVLSPAPNGPLSTVWSYP